VIHKELGKCAHFAAEREPLPVYRAGRRVYSDGGSGEPTETERLAGATPQTQTRVISDGSTSSNAHSREGVRRGVAAEDGQRMGREVHLQRDWRFLPSFFVSPAAFERRSLPPTWRLAPIAAWPIS
jgi:hypothetical protein